jgi:acyl-CoA thioesterase I
MSAIAKTLFLAAFLVPSAMAAEPMSPIDPAAYKAPVRVACIGDSITQGAGAAKGKSYPAQLQELLGASWEVGNFGVSGRTLLKKGDFPYWKENAYRKALGFKPDVVIIMLGTNDTKPQNWKHEAEFVADYTELVKSFLALESKPRVYVCRPCPVPEPGNFGINETNLKEEIKRIDQLAADLKLGVIDMHAALVAKPELLPDRVHPNTAGAGEMAKAAFITLTGKNATVSLTPVD